MHHTASICQAKRKSFCSEKRVQESVNKEGCIENGTQFYTQTNDVTIQNS